MEKTISPKVKMWITAVIRIIVIIASSIGGDAVDVIDLISDII